MEKGHGDAPVGHAYFQVTLPMAYMYRVKVLSTMLING